MSDYKELMRRRDEVNPSPSERAEYLYKYLQTQEPKPTLWDMICFAGEVLTVACEDLPSLQPNVKRIISSIYTAHYNVEEPFGSSVRSERNNVKNGGSSKPTPINPRPTLTLMRQDDEGKESKSGNASRNDNRPVGGTSE